MRRSPHPQYLTLYYIEKGGLMAPYRILSIDGGGIRGLLAAALLERLEAAHPGFLGQIDLFAGTSTGGILALGLASGFSPLQARLLYEELGPQVFSRSTFQILRSLGNLIGAKYAIRPLKDALAQHFGNLTLQELPRRVLISSFDLDNDPPDSKAVRTWKAKFFHNYPGTDSDGQERVVDVAVRTSAAPTYFPIYQGYIDGGVVANNPSTCALAQALNPLTGNQRLEDIVLLSVGTGFNPRFLLAEDESAGLLQWAPHLVNLMLEGGAGLADYQCRQILDRRYLRVNPLLPEPVAMDAVDRLSTLKRIGRQFDLSFAHAWIDRNF
jgi:uncharacterized protein